MERPDPIAAVATPPGRGAIGIVRISGAALEDFSQLLLGFKPEPRRAVLGDFLGADGLAIDNGLALYFPGPYSYTGEDVLELQGHGGIAVQQLLLRRCIELGARLAEPGEFTRRAYLNGKLDLAQAESVADLIDAVSQKAVRSALRSLKGEFSSEIQDLVNGLIALRAQVEVSIDFPEDEVDAPKDRAVSEALSKFKDQLGRITRAAHSGSVLREGATVVLAGAPNVGKSSLLNRLAGQEIAIVTSIAGTTRDAISAQINLDGVPIWVTDTAGLREPRDPVERIGVARSQEQIQRADLVLQVVDVTQYSTNAILNAAVPADIPRLIVENKIDLLQLTPDTRNEAGMTVVRVSAQTGVGMEMLRQEILRAIGYLPFEEGVFIARERHLVALRAAASHLLRTDSVRDQVELLAEELRQAQYALSQITGEYTSDDLMGEIFSQFCLGK